MTSIWEATCKCGSQARVELSGDARNRTLRVGCDDHWFELPADRLEEVLASIEREERRTE